MDDVGLYKVGFKVGYEEQEGSEVNCLKTIKVAYEPKFEGDKLTD